MSASDQAGITQTPPQDAAGEVEPTPVAPQSDDAELTDATTDEVVAWLEDRGPRPWPR